MLGWIEKYRLRVRLGLRQGLRLRTIIDIWLKGARLSVVNTLGLGGQTIPLVCPLLCRNLLSVCTAGEVRMLVRCPCYEGLRWIWLVAGGVSMCWWVGLRCVCVGVG